MSRRRILVTGGAGYIGSHVIAHLGQRGEDVLVLDDLSTGHAQALLFGKLLVGDVGDGDLMLKLLIEQNIDTVMHFAAKIIVPESVAKPLDYYDTNTARARVLLEACRLAGVSQFIFSSTAAVYGDVAGGIADEQTPTLPMNPYGRSKLTTEWMLRDLAAVTDLRFVTLRYFNVAGCDHLGRIGQDSAKSTNLINVACQHAAGKRATLEIFGSDYETPDGTCIRDYIHVEDLAAAHIAALEHLRNSGASLTANCGYGRGYSVREVIEVVRRVHGRDLHIHEVARRAGDIAKLVANADFARQRLGWSPKFDDLELIVSSALAWERKRMAKPLMRQVVGA